MVYIFVEGTGVHRFTGKLLQLVARLAISIRAILHHSCSSSASLVCVCSQIVSACMGQNVGLLVVTPTPDVGPPHTYMYVYGCTYVHAHPFSRAVEKAVVRQKCFNV